MAEKYTAATYVAAITAGEADRRARKAFQDLVLRIATPGAVLFDFGAGPGLDARFYADSIISGDQGSDEEDGDQEGGAGAISQP